MISYSNNQRHFFKKTVCRVLVMREIYFPLRFYVVCELKLSVFIKRIGVEKVLSNDLVIES